MGNVWSEPLLLSQKSASHVETPDIEIDHQDHLHIVFNDFDAGSPYGIRYRRYAYAETSGCKPVALITPSSGYHTVEEDVR